MDFYCLLDLKRFDENTVTVDYSKEIWAGAMD